MADQTVDEGARPVITLAEAKRLGLSHYWTGRPCKRGHIADRHVSRRFCMECERIRCRQWARENEDHKRRYDKARLLSNPEVHKQRCKAYRAKNPHKAAEDARRWKEANPQWRRQWNDANKDRHGVYAHNRRTRKLAAEGAHTPADIRRIRKDQRDRCAYCKQPLKGKGEVDHIVALANGGANWPSNLQLLCLPCNRAKHTSDPIDHAQKLGLLL